MGLGIASLLGSPSPDQNHIPVIRAQAIIAIARVARAEIAQIEGKGRARRLLRAALLASPGKDPSGELLIL